MTQTEDTAPDSATDIAPDTAADSAALAAASPTGDAPPDRLCNDPASPFYDEATLNRGIGIRFNGAEKTNVEEYCGSEGWGRVAAGKAVDRRGLPLTLKLKGKVEPYFRS